MAVLLANRVNLYFVCVQRKVRVWIDRDSKNKQLTSAWQSILVVACPIILAPMRLNQSEYLQ